MKNQTSLQGDLLILLAMGLFGGYALFLRFFSEISPLLFLLAFQIVGLVCFWPIAAKQGFPILPRREKWLLAGLAVVAVANDLFYFYSIVLTTVANATVAHQTVSVFMLFFAPFFLGVKTKRNEWIALALALVGTVILCYDGLILGQRHFFGIAMALVSAVFYALLIVIYKKEGERTKSLINTWRYGFSVLILLPILVINGTLGEFSMNMLWPLVAFGFLFAVIGTGIHIAGMGKTRPLHISIVGKSEPFFAVIYAAAFLGEIPGLRTIIGGILIIGSAIWLAIDTEGEI